MLLSRQACEGEDAQVVSNEVLDERGRGGCLLWQSRDEGNRAPVHVHAGPAIRQLDA
jgi:hypothetical protein